MYTETRNKRQYTSNSVHVTIYNVNETRNKRQCTRNKRQENVNRTRYNGQDKTM